LTRFGPLHRESQNDTGSIQLPTATSGPQGLAHAPKLTKRQAEVLRLLGQGQPTKQIARGLDLGIGTVKIHLTAVFKALNAKNRTEAALMATKFNL
jgi:DNA-binding NarL/FixJ family response regulator